jgi:signal transduction histidine kinase
MSKETAHQLGTPLSSLMAWVEVLQDMNIDSDIYQDMKKDIDRLNMVTDRFSKIGSKPTLKEVDVHEVLVNAINYIKARSSEKVHTSLIATTQSIIVPINTTLFSWVIENLFRNAVDAMRGDGMLEVELSETDKHVIIDISDTGKGIPKKNFKTIFKPGFTTKKRGWGLGLSLAKRIIENYHKGKIYVLVSELNKGTIFRIQLKK